MSDSVFVRKAKGWFLPRKSRRKGKIEFMVTFGFFVVKKMG